MTGEYGDGLSGPRIARESPKDERVVIHVRLPRELVRGIDHCAVDMDTGRAQAIEALLRLAMDKRRFGSIADALARALGETAARNHDVYAEWRDALSPESKTGLHLQSGGRG